MYIDLGIVYYLEGEMEVVVLFMIIRVESGDEDFFICYNLVCYLVVFGKIVFVQEELDYVLVYDEMGEFYELVMEDDELKGLMVRR